MAYLVPKKFLAGEMEAVGRTYANSSAEFPKPFLVIIICRVTLYEGLYLEFLVKLFHKESLVEDPP